ncbi:Os10g0393900, partial [Oryza sativa Japonica Group]
HGAGDVPVGRLGEVHAVPRHVRRRVRARRRPRRAAECRHVEVVRAGAGAAARGERRAPEPVPPRRGDDVGDGAVEVGVGHDDGRAWVRAAELGDGAAQLAVVVLGEAVQPRHAAGLRVVVVAGDAAAALVEREQLRLAAERYHPRHHHRRRSGGDHLLQHTHTHT